MFTSVKDAMSQMLVHYDQESAKTWEGVVQFDITGEENVKYWIELKNGKAELHEGETPSPGVTIHMSDLNFLAVTNRKAKASIMYLDEKIDVEGDFEILFKFEKTFPPPPKD